MSEDMRTEALDLAFLQAVEQAATPAPWESITHIGARLEPDSSSIANLKPKDATFIVTLRNAASALIAAARERDELKGDIGQARHEIAISGLNEKTCQREIEAQAARLAEVERQNADLQAANSAYRERAQRAEAALAARKDAPAGETTDTIVEAVRADLLERSRVGIAKYGVTLDRTDLSLRDWLQHAYEEHLDAANYLKRAVMEIDAGSPT